MKRLIQITITAAMISGCAGMQVHDRMADLADRCDAQPTQDDVDTVRRALAADDWHAQLRDAARERGTRMAACAVREIAESDPEALSSAVQRARELMQ